MINRSKHTPTPKTLPLILLLTLFHLSQTWHSTGHILIAQIARNRLLSTNPPAVIWAEQLIEAFSHLCGEGDHPFVESATWADKIKEEDWGSMFNWHFIDRVYNDEEKNTQKIFSGEDNAVWAINNCLKNLASSRWSARGRTNPKLGKSLAMRNLVHFVGDLHQPLHAVTRVTQRLPEGDSGGNFFTIKRYPEEKGQVWNNLHFVWDHLLDQYDEVKSPMSAIEHKLILKWAGELVEEFSFEDLKDILEKNPEPKDWALESYGVALEHVYKGAKEDEELSKDYVEEGRFIVRQRLVLGGYRLAGLIDRTFLKLSGSAPRKTG